MDDMWNVLFQLTLPGCGVLAITGLGCLIRCEGKNRSYLAWTVGLFLGIAVLWIGGGFLLSLSGLTWRDGVKLAVGFVLLLDGWVGVILILGCFLPAEWPDLVIGFRWAAKALVLFSAIVVFLVTLWFGPLVLAFGFGNEERVVEYQGQTLLEVDDGFLDPHFSYYEYHGPLVRGRERIYEGYEGLIGG